MTRRLRAFLLDYAYPGNIRELRNIIYRLSCLAGQTADIEHLPVDLRPRNRDGLAMDPVPGDGGHALSGDALSEAKRAASDMAERDFLERALQEVGGVVVELAKRCDMNRSHLQVLLKKHGIRPREIRAAARADKPN
jgi:DNA-binding NtrC family response regulator